VRPGTFEESQGRSFSRDPEVAGAAVAAFVAGLNAGDVLATLKHFPGLGAAIENTDDSSSVVAIPAEELVAIDLPPFTTGIDAGADLVMMSSAIYTSYDSLPAVMSPIVVEDVLRDELGFTGVIVSDALDTPALSSFGSVGEVAVTAAHAGVDLFIGSDTSTCLDVHAALTEALTSGTITLESGQATYERIQRLRSGLR
jgi:beta-N-acetylhexosaminidase